MAEAGQATQNAYAERVIRTIKEEEVYLSEYDTFADAQSQIGHFIEVVYQHKRIHSAPGYLTPAEFEAQWLATHAP
jgi:transposase InsO family protein